jgi:hypothetical protein
MRVKFERGQTTASVKTGIFSSKIVKTTDIRITIDFSEEEKATIAQSGLAEYAFYQMPPDPILLAQAVITKESWEQFSLGQISVGSLLEDNQRIIRYASLLDANRGDAELKEALQNLKAAIVAGKAAGARFLGVSNGTEL